MCSFSARGLCSTEHSSSVSNLLDSVEVTKYFIISKTSKHFILTRNSYHVVGIIGACAFQNKSRKVCASLWSETKDRNNPKFDL